MNYTSVIYDCYDVILEDLLILEEVTNKWWTPNEYHLTGIRWSLFATYNLYLWNFVTYYSKSEHLIGHKNCPQKNSTDFKLYFRKNLC